jgi:hypothetical protein
MALEMKASIAGMTALMVGVGPPVPVKSGLYQAVEAFGATADRRVRRAQKSAPADSVTSM